MNRSESRYFATAARMDEAFLTLLAKKDFEYITIKEICEVAGVNRSTFYLHYETMSDFHYICYRCDSAVCKNATKRNNERCLTTSSLSSKSHPIQKPSEVVPPAAFFKNLSVFSPASGTAPAPLPVWRLRQGPAATRRGRHSPGRSPAGSAPRPAAAQTTPGGTAR